MADITEIAIASWRLEKWLNNVNVERKMAAKSALRAINKYLQENNIEVLDLVGNKFDTGLAVSVVNNESEEKDEEKLTIIEMVKPIILQNGSVIQYGQVVLGDKVKEEKPNEVIQNVVKEKPEQNIIKESEKQIATKDSKTSSRWIVLFGISQITIVALIIYCIVSIGGIKRYFPIELNVPEQKEITIPDYSERFTGIENRLNNLETNGKTDSESIIRIESEISNINNIVEDIQNPKTQEKEIYTVVEGDSITKICEKYGYTFQEFGKEILQENNIENPDAIYIGQKIVIPNK